MNDLYYKSTRSNKEKILSSRAIVNGIAGDGGLYIPSLFPKIDKPFLQLKEMDYRQLAFYIMKKYLTDFDDKELKSCIDSAYDAKFDSPLIAPLAKVGEVFFLELYHGLTLAFKDMALSILPYLLKASVSKLNIGKDIVILTATSGDTGKAALEGFANVDGIKIIVFYPKEGVSQIQERQMTTQEGNNTYVIAIEGNFDDAQTGVKRIFSDKEFNRILNNNGYMFSSANSINIGRLIPQIVYYIYAYVKLLKLGEISSGEKINVVVPTGNFGNILSSYYAKKMGLPINKFICASNENNVLYDFINTGIYDKQRELKVTSSPSMDILISSNLERLLYDLSDNDASMVNGLIGELNKSGRYKINSRMKNKLGDFYGEFTTDSETIETIREVFKDFNYLIDTHTAVGYDVYKKYIKATGDKTKTVIASTASAFKFPESIIGAIDSKFRVSDKFALIERMAEITNKTIPKGIKDIGRRKIFHNTICKQEQMKSVISEILGL